MTPKLYAKLPDLYANIGAPSSIVPVEYMIGLSVGCLHLWSVRRPCAHVGSISRVTGEGGGWVGREEVKSRGRLREVNLTRNLLRQSQTGTRLPVGLALRQSNG